METATHQYYIPFPWAESRHRSMFFTTTQQLRGERSDKHSNHYSTTPEAACEQVHVHGSSGTSQLPPDMGMDFLDPDLPEEINSARLVGGVLIHIQPEER